MARRRLVVTAALLVALLVGVGALLRGGRSAPGVPHPSGVVAAPSPGRPALPAPPPAALAPPALRSLPLAPAADALANGAFEGHVVSAVTGEGIPGAQLTFARAEEAAAVSSGPDGAFRFLPRAPGRWLLAAATASGYLPFAPVWGESPVLLAARPGELVHAVTVRLSPAVEYDGRVVDGAGQPLAGAEIHVTGADPRSRLVSVPDRWTSDAAGAFRFSAAEGAVLEARREGFAPARASLDFTVRATRTMTIRLAPASTSLSISGAVEDAEGAPAEGALVTATRRHLEGPPASVRTDARGEFRLEGLAEGRWLVTATRASSAPASDVAQTGAADVRLRLGAGGRVTGRVRDARTGAPVTAFTVVVFSRTPRNVLVVDPGGTYELDDLAPGRAFLSVVARGYAPSDDVRVAVPEPGAPQATADFELTPGGLLRGVVLERGSGRPIAGARVEVEGAPREVPGFPTRTEATTDGDGRFALAGLGEGSTTLLASAPGHHGRAFSGPPLAEGATGGPVAVELTPLAAGETPRTELAGIGIVAAKRRDAIRIASVLPDGGAAEAGLVAGDEIVEIDGVSAARLSLEEAVPMLRGPEGTTVTLAVTRGAGDAPRAQLRVIVPRKLVRGG